MGRRNGWILASAREKASGGLRGSTRIKAKQRIKQEHEVLKSA
jgi:hypothetical protein